MSALSSSLPTHRNVKNAPQKHAFLSFQWQDTKNASIWMRFPCLHSALPSNTNHMSIQMCGWCSAVTTTPLSTRNAPETARFRRTACFHHRNVPETCCFGAHFPSTPFPNKNAPFPPCFSSLFHIITLFSIYPY